MTSERQAVLVFSNPGAIDCARRRWPRALQRLLELNDLPSWSRLGFDVHVFTSPGFTATYGTQAAVHGQHGSSFGQRLDNAVRTLTDLGYTKVVIVGSDCPDLGTQDIEQAFAALKDRQLVLGPDHRGGCYLIGLDVQDLCRLQGVHWQRNTDFEELLCRFGTENSWLLPVRIDLDTWEDVRLLAESPGSWRHIATALLRVFRPHPFSKPSSVQVRATEQRIRWQLPPPISTTIPTIA